MSNCEVETRAMRRDHNALTFLKTDASQTCSFLCSCLALQEVPIQYQDCSLAKQLETILPKRQVATFKATPKPSGSCSRICFSSTMKFIMACIVALAVVWCGENCNKARGKKQHLACRWFANFRTFILEWSLSQCAFVLCPPFSTLFRPFPFFLLESSRLGFSRGILVARLPAAGLGFLWWLYGKGELFVLFFLSRHQMTYDDISEGDTFPSI